jgi:hypothetical protein
VTQSGLVHWDHHTGIYMGRVYENFKGTAGNLPGGLLLFWGIS